MRSAAALGSAVVVAISVSACASPQKSGFFYEEHSIALQDGKSLPEFGTVTADYFKPLPARVIRKHSRLREQRDPELLEDPMRPFLLNGTLFAVRPSDWKTLGTNEIPNSYPYAVFRGSEPIHFFILGPGKKLDAFYGHKGAWILETGHEVVVAGENLDQKLHSEVFNYRFIADKPAFFGGVAERFSFFYDGKQAGQPFDEIAVNRDQGQWQLRYDIKKPLIPENYRDMVTFFGRRKKQWFYVEAGVEP